MKAIEHTAEQGGELRLTAVTPDDLIEELKAYHQAVQQNLEQIRRVKVRMQACKRKILSRRNPPR